MGRPGESEAMDRYQDVVRDQRNAERVRGRHRRANTTPTTNSTGTGSTITTNISSTPSTMPTSTRPSPRTSTPTRTIPSYNSWRHPIPTPARRTPIPLTTPRTPITYNNNPHPSPRHTTSARRVLLPTPATSPANPPAEMTRTNQRPGIRWVGGEVYTARGQQALRERGEAPSTSSAYWLCASPQCHHRNWSSTRSQCGNPGCSTRRKSAS